MPGTTAALRAANKAARHHLDASKPVSFNAELYAVCTARSARTSPVHLPTVTRPVAPPSSFARRGACVSEGEGNLFGDSSMHQCIERPGVCSDGRQMTAIMPTVRGEPRDGRPRTAPAAPHANRPMLWRRVAWSGAISAGCLEPRQCFGRGLPGCDSGCLASPTPSGASRHRPFSRGLETSAVL